MRDTWEGWGERLRRHKKAKGLKWGDIADKLQMSEVGIRKWINGDNDINLVDFFRLCAAMDADPIQILFGRAALNDEQRKMLSELVRGEDSPMPPPRRRSS
jgi:transcriptional regulator with XRE-family HTH domain